MIKYFQKLKAKKGFTLVELIVVIAIIGVLAAILIPTMLGYVTQSRVTSVDTTAASIKNNIDTFLTNADTAGYGMLKSNTKNSLIEFKITSGTWNASGITTASFQSGGGKSWSATGTGSAKQSKSGKSNAADLLCIELADLFPEIDTGFIKCMCVGGKCLAVYFTKDTTSTISTIDSNFDSTNGWKSDYITWDGTTAGVASTGEIVGTAPKLTLG